MEDLIKLNYQFSWQATAQELLKMGQNFEGYFQESFAGIRYLGSSLNFDAVDSFELSKEEKETLTYFIINDDFDGDLTPLLDCSNLEFIHIECVNGNQPIYDIKPLANLKNLKHLYIRGSNIKKISPLIKLKKLEYIHIYQPSSIDWSPLQGLDNLKRLKLAECEDSVVLQILNSNEHCVITYRTNKRECRTLRNILCHPVIITTDWIREKNNFVVNYSFCNKLQVSVLQFLEQNLSLKKEILEDSLIWSKEYISNVLEDTEQYELGSPNLTEVGNESLQICYSYKITEVLEEEKLESKKYASRILRSSSYGKSSIKIDKEWWAVYDYGIFFTGPFYIVPSRTIFSPNQNFYDPEIKSIRIKNDQIWVKKYCVKVNIQKHLAENPGFSEKDFVLDGVKPKRLGLNRNILKYKKPIRSYYSGTQYFMRGFIKGGMDVFAPVWEYKEVLLIEFINGKITNRKNISYIFNNPNIVEVDSDYRLILQYVLDAIIKGEHFEFDFNFERKIELIEEVMTTENLETIKAVEPAYVSISSLIFSF
tara:strand:+ start:249 stop:1859 length:1611 start_codon:yes stop_codon:yes gene_type:complete